jgi:hypothetical protein
VICELLFALMPRLAHGDAESFASTWTNILLPIRHLVRDPLEPLRSLPESNV